MYVTTHFNHFLPNEPIYQLTHFLHSFLQLFYPFIISQTIQLELTHSNKMERKLPTTRKRESQQNRPKSHSNFTRQHQGFCKVSVKIINDHTSNITRLASSTISSFSLHNLSLLF